MSGYNPNSNQFLPPPDAVPRMTITRTLIAVTSTSTQLLAANPARKYLSFMVVGANSVAIAPGASPAVFGSDMAYDPGIIAGRQGGSETFDAVVSTDAFQAVCNAGQTSTVVVWEGQ